MNNRSLTLPLFIILGLTVHQNIFCMIRTTSLFSNMAKIAQIKILHRHLTQVCTQQCINPSKEVYEHCTCTPSPELLKKNVVHLVNKREGRDRCFKNANLREIIHEADKEGLLSASTAYYYSAQTNPKLIRCGPNLTKVDLTNANVAGAQLQGSDLRYAKLKNAWCKCTNFSHANLSCADAEGANLEESDLRGATVKYVDFARASLKNANDIGTFGLTREKIIEELEKLDDEGIFERFATVRHRETIKDFLKKLDMEAKRMTTEESVEVLLELHDDNLPMERKSALPMKKQDQLSTIVS